MKKQIKTGSLMLLIILALCNKSILAHPDGVKIQSGDSTRLNFIIVDTLIANKHLRVFFSNDTLNINYKNSTIISEYWAHADDFIKAKLYGLAMVKKQEIINHNLVVFPDSTVIISFFEELYRAELIAFNLKSKHPVLLQDKKFKKKYLYSGLSQFMVYPERKQVLVLVKGLYVEKKIPVDVFSITNDQFQYRKTFMLVGSFQEDSLLILIDRKMQLKAPKVKK